MEAGGRFYLGNAADMTVVNEESDVDDEVAMGDALVWEMSGPARLVESAKVLTFRDVSIEEITHSDLPVPNQT